MISNFPHDLVALVDKDISDTILKNTYETGFDSGPMKRAPIDSLATRRIKLTYVSCDKKSFRKFQQWFIKDIKMGSQFFLWHDYMTGKWVRTRFTSQDLQGKPIDAFQEQWEMSFELECFHDESDDYFSDGESIEV